MDFLENKMKIIGLQQKNKHFSEIVKGYRNARAKKFEQLQAYVMQLSASMMAIKAFKELRNARIFGHGRPNKRVVGKDL